MNVETELRAVAACVMPRLAIRTATGGKAATFSAHFFAVRARSASSRHARIYESDGAWVAEDLGSTNGTWIDRTRLTTPTVLPIGAPLRVGRTTLVIQK